MFIILTNKNISTIACLLGIDEVTGAEIQSPRFKGDGRDRWNTTYNNLFSTWSNPAASTSSGGQSNFAVQVTGEAQGSQGSMDVRFFLSSPVDAPPSKPQSLVFTNANTFNQNPHLTWAANQEPDLWVYDIWRRYHENSTNFTEVARIAYHFSGTQYTDYGIRTRSNFIGNTITYWINSVDTYALTSVNSDSVSSNSAYLPKRQGDPLKPITSATQSLRYKINGSFPNPFNPSTTISYQLADDSHVVLEIYDLTGRRVFTLVEGRESAGDHTAEWRGINQTGASVSSGVYLYRFIATPTSGQHPFTSSGKLLLMK